MTERVPITVAYGDGIGPEIMSAALFILREAGAALEIETIQVGEKVYKSGNTSGIEPGAWDSLRRTKVFYKAPVTTPQGGGYKSINVTIRKTLGLYANLRPVVSYFPYISTKHPMVDMVIVRESTEGLFYTQGRGEVIGDTEARETLRITRDTCEKLFDFTFRLAQKRKQRGQPHIEGDARGGAEAGAIVPGEGPGRETNAGRADPRSDGDEGAR